MSGSLWRERQCLGWMRVDGWLVLDHEPEVPPEANMLAVERLIAAATQVTPEAVEAMLSPWLPTSVSPAASGSASSGRSEDPS